MNGATWWVPFATQAGTLIVYGVVAWTVLQVVRAEVDRHRQQIDALAERTSRQAERLERLENEVTRIRDGKR